MMLYFTTIPSIISSSYYFIGSAGMTWMMVGNETHGVEFAFTLATAKMRLATAWFSSAPKDTLVNHNLSCFLDCSGCKAAAILQ